MFNAEFEEVSLGSIIRRAGIIADTMSRGVQEAQAVQEKASEQFGAVSAEINGQILYIRGQLASAKSLKTSCAAKSAEIRKQIKPLSPLPDKPSVPQSAPPGAKQMVEALYQAEVKSIERENEICRKNNAECEKRINQLQISANELDSAISALENCLQKLQSCASKIISAQNEFENKRVPCLQKMNTAVKNMYGWCDAAQISYDCASDVLGCRDSAGGNGGLSLTFTINTSGHYSRSSYGGGSEFSDAIADFGGIAAVPKNSGDCRTVIINEKATEKVFEQIAGYGGEDIIIKIPASNLYKLGGEKFLEEMESFYTLIRNRDGIIGNDGYISWRKKQ